MDGLRLAALGAALAVCVPAVALSAQNASPEARILGRAFERVRVVRPGVDVEVVGGALLLDDGAVAITPSVLAVIRQGPDWIVDVRFRVQLGPDGGAGFENTTVGIGTTREEADRAVADDWVSSVGFALLAAHFGELPVRTPGDYRLFPGLPGSHTTVSPTWMDGSDPLHSRLLDVLPTVLRHEAPPDWTTVTIFFMRQPGEAGSVDCIVGLSRSSVCEEALGLMDWPPQPAAFMLKQTYVVRSVKPR